MAVKATLEAFSDFVTKTAGFKKDKNGENVKDKEGNEILVNARGNLSFLYNGISFADEAEALEYFHTNKISVSDVLQGAVNEAKGAAAAAAVKEVSKTIPATETISAETLKVWTEKAQTAASAAADRTIAPEISSRAQKAALETKVANLSDAYRADPNSVSKDDLLAAFLSLQSMEK